MLRLVKRLVPGSVRRGLAILYSPKEAFEKLAHESLEEVSVNYLKMLAISGVAAVAFYIIAQFFSSAYLEALYDVDIYYPNMLNYAVVISSSILAFYLFAGTFLAFFAALAIHIFQRKYKLSEMLKLVMYALTPIVLFGWIPPSPIPFSIWAIFLLAMGMKRYTPARVAKGSVQERD